MWCPNPCNHRWLSYIHAGCLVWLTKAPLTQTCSSSYLGKINSSPPIIAMSAPVSITPFAGTPWILTRACLVLLPLSVTKICLTASSPSESEDKSKSYGSKRSCGRSSILLCITRRLQFFSWFRVLLPFMQLSQPLLLRPHTVPGTLWTARALMSS